MTQEERLIISGYTGELMVSTSVFLKFAEKTLGRSLSPVEYGTKQFWEELRTKLKPRFREMCTFF